MRFYWIFICILVLASCSHEPSTHPVGPQAVDDLLYAEHVLR